MKVSFKLFALLLLVSIFVQLGCVKEDPIEPRCGSCPVVGPSCIDCPIDDNGICQDSVVFNFEMYGFKYSNNYGVDNYAVLSCQNPETLKLSIHCDTLLKLSNGTEVSLTFINDHWYGEWFDSYYSEYYKYYPCKDSLVVAEQDYSWGSYAYSKALKSTAPCSPGPLPVICNNNGEVCYYSLEKRVDYTIMDNAKYVLEPDSTLQEVAIRFKESSYDRFSITVPADSSNSIKTGNYWIGTVPSGDQPILDCHYLEYSTGFQVPFSNFHAGCLTVSEVNNNFNFSWKIYGCNESIWSGNVNDPF